MTRYSCPKCGAYVGNSEPDEWEFATGMLSSVQEPLDRVQMWIEDTRRRGRQHLAQEKANGTNSIRHLRERSTSEAHRVHHR